MHASRAIPEGFRTTGRDSGRPNIHGGGRRDVAYNHHQTRGIGRLGDCGDENQFLNGAREEDFLCHAKILKLGRRLVYGVAECTTREGKLLTHNTITYIRP